MKNTPPIGREIPREEIVVTDWASLERKWSQFNFAVSIDIQQHERDRLAYEIDQFITRIRADSLINRGVRYITILERDAYSYGSEICYLYSSTLTENIQRICAALNIPLPSGYESSVEKTMYTGSGERSPRATIPMETIGGTEELSGSQIGRVDPRFEAIPADDERPRSDERPTPLDQLDELPQEGILPAIRRNLKLRYLAIALGLAGATLFITKTRSTTSDERPNTSMGTSAPAAPKTKSAPPVPPNKWQYSRDCSVRFTQGVGHRILCEDRTDYDITPKVETLGRDTGKDGNTSRMIVVSFKHPPGITLPAASCASLPFRIAEGLSGLYRDVLFRCVDEQSPK